MGLNGPADITWAIAKPRLFRQDQLALTGTTEAVDLPLVFDPNLVTTTGQ